MSEMNCHMSHTFFFLNLQFISRNSYLRIVQDAAMSHILFGRYAVVTTSVARSMPKQCVHARLGWRPAQ